MSSVYGAFKHNHARKNVIIGGAVILICITALPCVSSFLIYRAGFADMPFIFQHALACFALRWSGHYYETDGEGTSPSVRRFAGGSGNIPLCARISRH